MQEGQRGEHAGMTVDEYSGMTEGGRWSRVRAMYRSSKVQRFKGSGTEKVKSRRSNVLLNRLSSRKLLKAIIRDLWIDSRLEHSGMTEDEHSGMTEDEHSGMTVGEHSGMTVGEHSGMTVDEHSGMTVGEHSGMTVGEHSGMTKGGTFGNDKGRACRKDRGVSMLE